MNNCWNDIKIIIYSYDIIFQIQIPNRSVVSVKIKFIFVDSQITKRTGGSTGKSVNADDTAEHQCKSIIVVCIKIFFRYYIGVSSSYKTMFSYISYQQQHQKPFWILHWCQSLTSKTFF
jgi:hypothetical protein